MYIHTPPNHECPGRTSCVINTLQEIKTNLGPNTLIVVREPGRKDAPGATLRQDPPPVPALYV